jgi:hypothetical protein
MGATNEVGSVIGSLSFEAGGEASNVNHPTVLSCGGIFFPKSKVPKSLKTWKQIVNLPSNVESAAKVFRVTPPDAEEALFSILQKEILN